MSDSQHQVEVLRIAGQIVASYISENPMSFDQIPAMIQKVYQALSETQRLSSYRTLTTSNPAVSVEDSVTDDYIICLEDGKKLQMLKRHLSTVYKMTPDQYKERWGLPSDYPIVAPRYARRRSQIAKDTGLGHTGRRKRVKSGMDVSNSLTLNSTDFPASMLASA